MSEPIVRGTDKNRVAAALFGFALLTACATIDAPRGSSGYAYVAMGSSFAAGPGVTVSADQPSNRCGRSTDNYAHLVARKLNLNLTDVSCSGATTSHVLGGWNDLPPQVDALTADTKLVTVTIGGNDVAYLGTLGSASCRSFASPPAGTPRRKCPVSRVVAADAWADLEKAMHGIALEVRRRSPSARLVFVDYLTVLPEQGVCANTPLPSHAADASRATATRLAALTARVARETRSEILKASALSKAHNACAADPWVTGFPLPGMKRFLAYHPNERGMEAIARALMQHLREQRPGGS